MFVKIWWLGFMFGKGDINDPDWVWISTWLWVLVPAGVGVLFWVI